MRPLKLSININLKAITVLIFLFVSLQMASQPPRFQEFAYIERFSGEALNQMVEFKIPASVILAQAIFESRSGTSDLAKKSNNHFGIKCHTEWGGDTVVKTDDTLNECFRKYANIEESYFDHSMFLRSRARYSQLFDIPVSDYKRWCYGLKQCGYATYPAYAEELIRIIEQTGLYELDRSENLNSQLLLSRKEELIPSTISAANFSLSDFLKGGLLWVDENDLFVRSLEIVVESPEEETIDIAEK